LRSAHRCRISCITFPLEEIISESFKAVFRCCLLIGDQSQFLQGDHSTLVGLLSQKMMRQRSARNGLWLVKPQNYHDVNMFTTGSDSRRAVSSTM